MMKAFSSTSIAAIFLLAAKIACAAPQIDISEPWARDSAGLTRVGGIFLGIANHGSEPDQLVPVTSPAAKRAELHETVKDGEIMRMRPVQAIPVGAGQTVTLKPGGLHIMLMDLAAPLKQGGTVSLVLTFQHAGQIPVEVPIRAAGASAGGAMAPMHNMGGK